MNASEETWAGKVLEGRYRVTQRLGTGGMGTVVLADDRLRKETVCLKLLTGAPEDPEEKAFLVQEFRILKSLRHPNLETVHDFGTLSENGIPYFSSEYIEGSDLFAASEGLDAGAVTELVAQACRALHFIHSRDLVHLDVKPQNFLVTKDPGGAPLVKLIDFGLASEKETRFGARVRGTPAYMAPEILRGEPVGPRADLYSLGVTFYQLLARRLPHPPGASTESLLDRMGESIAPPDTAAGPLPPGLLRVLLRMLEPVPDRRFASAMEVLEALGRARGRPFEAETEASTVGRVLSGTFSGREKEMEKIEGLLAAGNASAKIHLVTGEAGIGKTRLLQEAATRAQIAGWRTVRGNGLEAGGEAFEPLRSILKEILQALGPRHPATRAHGPLALRIVPDAFEADRTPEDAPPLRDPTALMEGLSGLLLEASRDRPLFVIVDDLQWADGETLELLAFLLRRIAVAEDRERTETPLLLFGALRDGEPAKSPALRFAGEIEAGGLIDPMPLEPLTKNQVVNLVRSMFGGTSVPETFLEGLVAASRGNPLFVEASLEHLAEGGRLRRGEEGWVFPKRKEAASALSGGLSGLFESILGEVGAEDRPVLEALAVWERPVAARALSASLADVSPSDLAASLRRLKTRGILERLGTSGEWTWRIRYGLFRAFVHDRIPDARRKNLHRLAGRFLAERGAEAGPEAEEAASHLLAGRDAEAGIEMALEASRSLRGIFHHARALALLEKALALTDPADARKRAALLFEKAHNLVRSGDPAGMLDVCRELETLLSAGGEKARADMVQVLLNAGEMLRVLGRSEEALDLLDRSERLASERGDAVSAARARLFRANVFFNRGRFDEGVRLVSKTLEEVPAIRGSEEEGFAQVDLANAYTRSGETEKATAALDRAEAIFEDHPERKGLTSVHRFRGTLEISAGRLDRAVEHLSRAVEIGRETGNRKEEVLTLEMLAHACWQLALYAEGERHLKRGLTLSRILGDKVGEHRLLGIGGLIASARGEIDEARAQLETVVRFWDGRKMAYFSAISRSILASLEARSGRLDGCLAALRETARVARQTGDPALIGLKNRVFGIHLAERGKTASALRALARNLGRPSPEADEEAPRSGATRSLRSLLLARAGRFEEAEAEARRASKAFQASGNVHERMEDALRQSVRRRETGDLEASRTILEALLDRSRETGNRLLEMSAHAGLGETLLRAGLLDPAEEHFQRGLALNRGMPALLEGCALRLGLSELLAVRGEGPAARTLAGEALETALRARSRPLASRARDRLRALENLPEAPARPSPAILPGTGKTGVALQAILDVFQRFHAGEEAQALVDRVLDAAIAVSEAKRGFLLLHGKDGLESASARNFHGKDERARDFSGTVAREVFRTGEAVLSADAGADPAFAGAQSIRDLRLKSVLCVPLRAGGGRIGAVYLDDPERAEAFGEQDRLLLQGLSDLAGIALDAARLRFRLEASEAELRERALNLEEHVKTQIVALEAVREKLHAREKELEGRDMFGEILGRSDAMRKVFGLLDRVTASSLPVVLEGETGTGKELAARAVHAHGPRKAGPFVDVNCAAIPETLLESELFGHVKGAFTGADRDRKGLFVLASGGTLFLDEIGDLPLALQAKLLRVLQEGEVRPVGARASVPVDVRIVCASNRNLETMVGEGRFREDLFYRLRVLHLRLPPLRERKEDVPLLAETFLSKHLEAEGKASGDVRFTTGALRALSSHGWPGNVRELKNVVESASVFARKGRITARDVGSRLGLDAGEEEVPAPAGVDFRKAKARFEKAYLEGLLQSTGGNVSETARRAGLERGYVHRLMKKYGLDAGAFREG